MMLCSTYLVRFGRGLVGVGLLLVLLAPAPRPAYAVQSNVGPASAEFDLWASADTIPSATHAPLTDSPGQTSQPPGRFGLAAAEVLGINLFVWSWNYATTENRGFQVSPGTMWRNLSRYRFDKNSFGTNQIAHPFHGAMYFNAARSNGFNYWQSAGFTLAGSFMWECCLETEPQSINDLLMTTLGGLSMGESTHRLAALIFRPDAVGVERFGRGMASFLIDPLGGFNRVATGRSSAAGQPHEGTGAVPVWNTMRFGMRGTETDFSNSGRLGQDGGLFDLDLRYGDPFRAAKAGPYDYFRTLVQLDFSGPKLMSQLMIAGSLWARMIDQTGSSRHVLDVNQRFDLQRNEAFEYGGTSVTAGLRSKHELTASIDFRTTVALEGIFLGGVVTPNYSWRPNDYGPGLGLRAQAGLTRAGFDLLRVGYVGQWIHVVDGAATEHLVQTLEARAAVPLFWSLGVGADYRIFLRDSRYRPGMDLDVHLRQNELRLYAALFAR